MTIFALILLILITLGFISKFRHENTLDVGSISLMVFFVLYLMGVGS
jgi:hypothetical protein